MYQQKSFVLRPSEADKKWFVIDARDVVVGKLATTAANLLRGKMNPQYTPNTDSGHFVVIVNAEKVKFTGNKWDDKKYYRHSGHVGKLKTATAREVHAKNPCEIVEKAIKGMLPKNSLGRKQLTKLKVFAGEEHTHQAQNPEAYTVS